MSPTEPVVAERCLSRKEQETTLIFPKLIQLAYEAIKVSFGSLFFYYL